MVKQRAEEARMDRLIIWMYYYLGVTDDISAALESFKGIYAETLKDAEWRVELRNYLPPELAALRQPNANTEPAFQMIEREAVQALQKTKR
jgi:hypothetical protein